MIGLAIHPEEREIAREFFELFKTPWEFYQKGQQYDVLICTQEPGSNNSAKLILAYSAAETSFDRECNIPVKPGCKGAALSYDGRHLPLYGNAATFVTSDFFALKEKVTQEPLAFLKRSKHGEILRVGYDLFSEVRFLLTVGQPSANAGSPTLDLHIALLRELITRSGIPLIEIPPVPDGYSFVACLTHDVDHPLLKNHIFDHTMFGFLYRATLGSLLNRCRGRISLKTCYHNWLAACALPLVYLDMAPDPWCAFDRYREIEQGLGSTYFVIPNRGYPGRQAKGRAPAKRASRYSVKEIKPELERVISEGHEVALHGIDAWLESSSGVEERQALSRDLGAGEAGVRMHWLYFDERSPAALDQAGFSYDSSVGYNDTVGFRAGTAQAYKPLGAEKLLELPLQIMDTALFYPRYLNLSEGAAAELVRRLLDDIEKLGGAVTINWHDRSIAPERSWDGFYLDVLGELKRRGAWFPTAARAVSWFRKRRSASFQAVACEGGRVNFGVTADADPESPGLRVRVHQPKARHLSEAAPANSGPGYVDVGFKGQRLETSIGICV